MGPERGSSTGKPSLASTQRPGSPGFPRALPVLLIPWGRQRETPETTSETPVPCPAFCKNDGQHDAQLRLEAERGLRKGGPAGGRGHFSHLRAPGPPPNEPLGPGAQGPAPLLRQPGSAPGQCRPHGLPLRGPGLQRGLPHALGPSASCHKLPSPRQPARTNVTAPRAPAAQAAGGCSLGPHQVLASLLPQLEDLHL